MVMDMIGIDKEKVKKCMDSSILNPLETNSEILIL